MCGVETTVQRNDGKVCIYVRRTTLKNMSEEALYSIEFTGCAPDGAMFCCSKMQDMQLKWEGTRICSRSV